MTSTQLLMAFDFGDARTGVAIGQAITFSAQPLTTIKSIQQQPNWPAITTLLQEWQPTQLIVGIPGECEENKALRKKINRFSNELRERYDLPVQLHDETLTSAEAYQQLKIKRQQGKGKIDKAQIDSLAAALILESWMNAELNHK